jgi:hypothetical protein
MTDNETRTPVPVFEEQTGYLCLSDGRYRQVVLRFEWPNFYFLWTKDKPKVEIRLRIDRLFRLLVK